MLDLIWTVPPRSDGPDLIRVRGGGGARRGDFSRGGAAWEPAGLRRFGDSRTGLGRGLAVEHARGTSKPLGHSAGRCGVQGGGRGGGGGSAQQSSPAWGAPAATEGYGLRNCVQKVRGKRVGAHRALNWTESGAAGLEARYGGAAWTGGASPRGFTGAAGPRAEKKGSGTTLVSRRCSCATWPVLRCGGAAWSRWHGALLRSELGGRRRLGLEMASGGLGLGGCGAA
jgi:hypothetical protein